MGIGWKVNKVLNKRAEGRDTMGIRCDVNNELNTQRESMRYDGNQVSSKQGTKYTEERQDKMGIWSEVNKDLNTLENVKIRWESGVR